jgi:NAD-dependent SIR2 family protein deacetylase
MCEKGKIKNPLSGRCLFYDIKNPSVKQLIKLVWDREGFKDKIKSGPVCKGDEKLAEKYTRQWRWIAGLSKKKPPKGEEWTDKVPRDIRKYAESEHEKSKQEKRVVEKEQKKDKIKEKGKEKSKEKIKEKRKEKKEEKGKTSPEKKKIEQLERKYVELREKCRSEVMRLKEQRLVDFYESMKMLKIKGGKYSKQDLEKIRKYYPLLKQLQGRYPGDMRINQHIKWFSEGSERMMGKKKKRTEALPKKRKEVLVVPRRKEVVPKRTEVTIVPRRKEVTIVPRRKEVTIVPRRKEVTIVPRRKEVTIVPKKIQAEKRLITAAASGKKKKKKKSVDMRKRLKAMIKEKPMGVVRTKEKPEKKKQKKQEAADIQPEKKKECKGFEISNEEMLAMNDDEIKIVNLINRSMESNRGKNKDMMGEMKMWRRVIDEQDMKLVSEKEYGGLEKYKRDLGYGAITGRSEKYEPIDLAAIRERIRQVKSSAVEVLERKKVSKECIEKYMRELELNEVFMWMDRMSIIEYLMWKEEQEEEEEGGEEEMMEVEEECLPESKVGEFTSEYEAGQGFCFLLGAGAPSDLGLPTFSNMDSNRVKELTDRLWYIWDEVISEERKMDKTGTRKERMEVAEMLRVRVGGMNVTPHEIFWSLSFDQHRIYENKRRKEMGDGFYKVKEGELRKEERKQRVDVRRFLTQYAINWYPELVSEVWRFLYKHLSNVNPSRGGVYQLLAKLDELDKLNVVLTYNVDGLEFCSIKDDTAIYPLHGNIFLRKSGEKQVKLVGGDEGQFRESRPAIVLYGEEDLPSTEDWKQIQEHMKNSTFVIIGVSGATDMTIFSRFRPANVVIVNPNEKDAMAVAEQLRVACGEDLIEESKRPNVFYYKDVKDAISAVSKSLNMKKDLGVGKKLAANTSKEVLERIMRRVGEFYE